MIPERKKLYLRRVDKMDKRYYFRRNRSISAVLTIPFLLSTALLTSCGARPVEPETNQSDEIQSPREEANKDLSAEEKLLELEMIGYANAVDAFIEIDTQSVREKIANGERFYLYIGRSTCQWCRKLAPSLQYASSKREVDIYYLDSTDTQTDNDLSSFRKEYAIETVPDVILFSESDAPVHLDIDITADDMNEEMESALERPSKAH